MGRFRTILLFELKQYLKNKIFLGITIFLMVTFGIIMSFPRITALFQIDSGNSTNEKRPIMLLKVEDQNMQEVLEYDFQTQFASYEIKMTSQGEEFIKEQIETDRADCAFVIEDPVSFVYYVKTLYLADSKSEKVSEILKKNNIIGSMLTNGMTVEQANEAINMEVRGRIENLGKDQTQNFFYTYIMLFVLYMVILLYGQMVSMAVATEKSSRAMELLITSADPVAMLFGKVLASCMAGLLQLAAVFGSAILFFHLNTDYWGGDAIVNSIFNIPPVLMGYMLLFFVLGFLIYAFLFGALGSLATKVEDINTSTIPLTMLFIIAFFVVVYSITSGSLDNGLMVACSYIPFTSPMAMFARIAMSTVKWYEIIISVVLLILTTGFIGIISARVYRIGVLMYGTPVRPGSIIRLIRKKKSIK